jgi:hypothetical protein
MACIEANIAAGGRRLREDNAGELEEELGAAPTTPAAVLFPTPPPSRRASPSPPPFATTPTPTADHEEGRACASSPAAAAAAAAAAAVIVTAGAATVPAAATTTTEEEASTPGPSPTAAATAPAPAPTTPAPPDPAPPAPAAPAAAATTPPPNAAADPDATTLEMFDTHGHDTTTTRASPTAGATISATDRGPASTRPPIRHHLLQSTVTTTVDSLWQIKPRRVLEYSPRSLHTLGWFPLLSWYNLGVTVFASWELHVQTLLLCAWWGSAR